LAPHRGLAAAAAFSIYLDRHTVGMQAVLLTEWLTALAMIGSLYVWSLTLNSSSYVRAVWTGAMFGLAALIRPSCFPLIILISLGVLGVRLLYRNSGEILRRQAVCGFLMVLVAWLITVPWRLVVWMQIGIFSLSMIGDLSLSNHVGSIMERASDRHAVIRDIYLELRPEARSHIDTCWPTQARYAELTGEHPGLGARKLRDAAIDVIVNNPMYFVSNLATGFYRIWVDLPYYVTDYTDPHMTPGESRQTSFYKSVMSQLPFAIIYKISDKVLWGQPLVLAFLPVLIVLAGITLTIRHRKDQNNVILIWGLIGTVFYHNTIHIIGNFTEFGRYRLPAHPLWISVLALVFYTECYCGWVRYSSRRAISDTTQQ
jgi:membrane protein CcdC involved in cytochrome C biogenesis